MIKRTIKETIEKYNEEGKLIEKITREETESDDETRYPLQSPTYPSYPWGTNETGTNINKPAEIIHASNNPYTVNCSSRNEVEK